MSQDSKLNLLYFQVHSSTALGRSTRDTNAGTGVRVERKF